MNTWQRVVIACLSLIALGIAPAGAAPPGKITVTAATPSSAYQGDTLDVAVGGSGFDPSARVQFFLSGTTNPGGITVSAVKYTNSGELVTTITVSSDADLGNFDIQVTLDNGRKGKGTTLFKVDAKPGNGPPGSSDPVPTYPAERAWHSFKSNGGTSAADSRLYMYGGSGADWQVVPGYFWFYGANDDKWSLVMPGSTTSPGPLQWTGLSCGAGACVLATGSNGIGMTNETWVYNESGNTWAQVTCRRSSGCPSARQMTTMAFDPDHGSHLLFGGLYGSTGFSDTLTFDPATLKWTTWRPKLIPSERNRAAAVHVPGVGIVMHGGQGARGSGPFCDLYAWDGSNWRSVGFDTNKPYPCLHTHSAAWDSQAQVLVVTGGYVDTSDTPNPALWRFTFAAGGQSGSWSQDSNGTCQAIGSTDYEIHPGAQMAFDVPSATRVWFGGEKNFAGVGAVRYGNTVECY